MRWPFGPPHLTLKPSQQKTRKNIKKTNKKNKQKKNQKKKQKLKKHKNTKKRAFQLSVKISLFWGGVFQKLPFLTTWPRKRAPPKHYKNRGFSTPILKNSYASRNGHFWTKKTQIHKFQLSFFFAFFFSFNNKKHKALLKTLFL